LQSRLSGAQRFSLAVKGEADGLEELISQVTGITSVSSLVEGEVEIETIPGQDPRPEVARAVVEAGYDLLEMRIDGMSLEDIFLQLTREEPTMPEMAAYYEDDIQ
jgi:ABC-2 type transport system ATP-binding protein